MGLLNFWKQETTAERAYHGFESYVLPPTRNALQSLSGDAALSLATVFRAIDILATNVAQLDLQTFRGGETLPNPLVVKQPDSNRPLSAFLKRTVTCLAMHGNAFWFKTYNGASQVVNISVLNPLDVAIEFDEKGNKRYRIGDKTYGDDKIVHLRKSEFPGHDEGVGPLQAYRAGIGHALDLHAYSGRTMANRGIPTGILSVSDELDPEIADAHKARWQEVVDQGGIVVTDKGTEFSPITLSAVDLQFIESVKLSDLTIARIFGIPAAYMDLEVGGTSLTYTNLQTINRQFVQNTLGGYLREIEDAFTSCLPRGTHVEFDLTNLLRGDDAEIKKKETTPVATEAA